MGQCFDKITITTENPVHKKCTAHKKPVQKCSHFLQSFLTDTYLAISHSLQCSHSFSGPVSYLMKVTLLLTVGCAEAWTLMKSFTWATVRCNNQNNATANCS